MLTDPDSLNCSVTDIVVLTDGDCDSVDVTVTLTDFDVVWLAV